MPPASRPRTLPRPRMIIPAQIGPVHLVLAALLAFAVPAQARSSGG